MIKLVYLTDIHDGLLELKKIFQLTSADLYILSGDIIYKAFFSTDRIIDFCTYQEELNQLAKTGGDDMTPYDFATKVIRFPDKYSESIQQKCSAYRHFFNLAAKTMKEKYRLINALIEKYARSRCVILPGNYDIDLQYTDLSKMDIHRKSFEFEDTVFAGYGGAPIVTSGIPEKLAVKFHEYKRGKTFYSEPEEFFREILPDVAVIHNPAYGYLDKIPGYGNIGSLGIRHFIDEYPPALVISGHVHEDQGVVKKGRTVFFNPSNFGGVDSVFGYQEGGYFGEIYMEHKKVFQVKLLKLKGEEIRELFAVDASSSVLRTMHFDPDSGISEENFVRK